MTIEQIDDLPLLGKIIQELQLPLLYEQHFADHGHWVGISGGQLLFGWLLYILSEGDHRLCHVEDWAGQRLNILSAVMGSPELRRLDFSDDRLAIILDKLADDEKWEAFEQLIGRQILQVYRPSGKVDKNDSLHVVRADTFNLPQFRDTGELFQHGYSKQRRDDLPFCKVMVGYIDELSIPLSVDVVKGAGPDYEHYLPTINKVRAILDTSGNLYVGDSALGTTSNRADIHVAGDYYLCPLSRKQVTQQQLDEYLDRRPPGPVEDLPGVFTHSQEDRSPAYFFELSEQVPDLQPDSWREERRILVYSPQYTNSLLKSFYNRLDEAEEKIKNLVVSKKGRRNPTKIEDLRLRIAKIEEDYQIVGCFNTQCAEMRTPVAINKHKDRPARIVDKVTLSLVLERNASAIEKTAARLGWQIYGSNAPQELFTTAQLVTLYRDEYSIEHFFNYFINRDVGLLPVYLKKERRAKALVRLLSIAMKCSMLVQFKIRAALIQTQGTISGVYPGNRGRKTARPTTPMILRAFKGVAWASPLQSSQFMMTPLNDTQRTILELMQHPLLYEEVVALLKPSSFLGET